MDALLFIIIIAASSRIHQRTTLLKIPRFVTTTDYIFVADSIVFEDPVISVPLVSQHAAFGIQTGR